MRSADSDQRFTLRLWRRVLSKPILSRQIEGHWAATVVGYLIFASLICFYGLGSSDAVTMEGIVADGALQMAATGQFSVPRLYGEIYTYKPPLAYWMALGSFEAFGQETEWTLRFPFALSVLLMGLAVLLATHRALGLKTALLCAIASLTGVLTVQKLHLAEFDTPLAAGVGIAAALACRNFTSQRPRVALWMIGYLALAAAFLAKGIPALMFYIPGCLLAAAWTGRLRDLWRPGHLLAVALFSGVIGAWILGAYAAEGWAAFEQPLTEADTKGFTWSTAAVVSTLIKPGVLWALFLPWTLVLPTALSSGLRRPRGALPPAELMIQAAGGFVVAGLLTFMLVPATESRYLLPLAAPVGILGGVLCTRGFRGRLAKPYRRSIEMFVLVVGLAALGFTFRIVSTVSLPDRALLLLSAGTASTLAVLSWRRCSGELIAPLLLAVALVSWTVQIVAIEPHRANSRSLRSVAAAFERHLPAGETVWTAPLTIDFGHSSLFFYLRRPVATFSPEDGDRLQPGDFVVLFSDEHPRLLNAPPVDWTILERRSRRDHEFLLARVR